MGMTYEESMARNARQRAYIEALRKKTEAPEGKMVGGQFIAPHWSQQLQPALNQAIGGYMSSQQDKQDEALRQQMQTGAADWMAARPQTTQQEVQGPPEEGQVQPTRAIEPSQQQKLAWAQQGTNNPLTKALAAKYGEDILVKEPERDEAREARRENLKAQQQARMDQIREQGAQRIQELELRLQDQNLTREQTARIQAQLDETKRYINDQTNKTNLAIQGAHDDTRKEIAEKERQTKLDINSAGKPPKPLPAAQSKAWNENAVAIKKTMDAMDMLAEKDPITGKHARRQDGSVVMSKLANDSMGAKYMIPFSEEAGQRLDKKGVPLRAAIADIGSLKIHDRSGAAVPAKEMEVLKPFIPKASDTPEAAYDKMQNFMKHYKMIQQEILNYAEDQGYKTPTVRDGPGVTTPPAAGGGIPAGWSVVK